MTHQSYQHWKLEMDQDKILWLTFDRKNKPVNTLNPEVLLELEEIVDAVATDSSAIGVVIRSGKEKGFIAGADIEQFLTFKDEDSAYQLVRKAQVIFDKLEALNVPTAAMINGFCLGGGAELALACRYRIADEDEARIGLPEVKLGINPGWGGTIRLPRLIGAPAALDMILSGRIVNGRTAAKMGIADEAVPKRQLERAARSYILRKPKPHEPGFIQGLTNSAPVRPLLAKMIRGKLEKKARKEHYPAPYAILDHWVNFGVDGQKGMVDEAKTISRLFFSETSKNLVRVFFLQDEMKALSKGITFAPKHVHVIGAGTMGGDIAAWCALRGMTVTLQDREPKYIAPAIKRATDTFKAVLKQPRLVQAALDRLMPDVESTGVSKADVVIVAIFENLQAKQALYQDLEKRMKPDAILATNTSSLPLDELNTVLKKPERLVGIHFFNPVAKMLLVEVVAGEKTDPKVVDKAIAFVRAIDRLPLPVKSKPGFLVNRALMPYLLEAMVLMEEGVSPAAIDQAAVQFGMPMGPVELADTIGLDVCLSVAKILTQYYGGEVPKRLLEIVEKGELGRKSGRGFYVYRQGKVDKSAHPAGDPAKTSPDLADRLIMRMLNETAACIREEVISDVNLLDGGMIFGTGFAPFRGGPLHYAKSRGIDAVVARLNELSGKYGERFKPDQGWSILKKEQAGGGQAKAGKKPKADKAIEADAVEKKNAPADPLKAAPAKRNLSTDSTASDAAE